MGVCADLCAEYNFREEDKYAIQSYERSAKAWEAGKFDEVVPVAVPQRKGDPIIVSKDEEFTNVKMKKINLKRCFFKRRNRNCS
jgi:acetyl-CoA C-acetyltransferase